MERDGEVPGSAPESGATGCPRVAARLVIQCRISEPAVSRACPEREEATVLPATHREVLRDWEEVETSGEPPWSFFGRLPELRLRNSEVALCQQAVHRFCERVPPPRID